MSARHALFDPAKPAANSPLASAEMRAQFNGLKEIIDAQEARIAALAATARNPAAGELSISFNDPPTASQAQEIVTALNNLRSDLHR